MRNGDNSSGAGEGLRGPSEIFCGEPDAGASVETVLKAGAILQTVKR